MSKDTTCKAKDKTMYQTGEQVREGFYCCCNCQKQDAVVHLKDGQVIGDCKYCGSTTWYKI